MTEHDLTTPEGREAWEADELVALARTASTARQKADDLLEEGRPRDAQSAITVAGICWTKLREVGESSRPEPPSFEAIDNRLRELIEAIHQRQAIATTSRPALPAAREQGDQ